MTIGFGFCILGTSEWMGVFKVNFDLQKLDLMDLISERHLELRKLSENLWNDTSDIYISNSVWFILTRISQQDQTTISLVTKSVDISRQATHKLIKKLAEKGLVEIGSLKNNKKEKAIKLTKLGKECFEKHSALKRKLENKIAEKIGMDQLENLKEILRKDWGL